VVVSTRKKISGWVWRAWDFALFLLPYLLPPGAGGVAATLALAEGVPAYLVFLYALAAFCLCAFALASVFYVIRHRGVFERLRYARTEPLFVHPNPDKGTVGVIFKCNLQNMSLSRSMYISLRRADAQLQGKVNSEPTLFQDVIIVPAFSEVAITTAAVPEIDVLKEIKGKLELEILYGPTPDDLRYILSYVIQPTIEIRELTEKGAQVFVAAPLRKYEHRRA
jgi:hypothetical protein